MIMAEKNASTEVLVNHPQWNIELLSNLSQFQISGMLCDTTLECSDNVSVHAHSCILAAASRRVKSLLQGAALGYYTLMMREVKSSTWQNILRFIYDGKVTVKRDEIDILYNASRLFQINRLTEALYNSGALTRCHVARPLSGSNQYDDVIEICDDENDSNGNCGLENVTSGKQVAETDSCAVSCDAVTHAGKQSNGSKTPRDDNSGRLGIIPEGCLSQRSTDVDQAGMITSKVRGLDDNVFDRFSHLQFNKSPHVSQPAAYSVSGNPIVLINDDDDGDLRVNGSSQHQESIAFASSSVSSCLQPQSPSVDKTVNRVSENVRDQRISSDVVTSVTMAPLSLTTGKTDTTGVLVSALNIAPSGNTESRPLTEVVTITPTSSCLEKKAQVDTLHEQFNITPRHAISSVQKVNTSQSSVTSSLVNSAAFSNPSPSSGITAFDQQQALVENIMVVAQRGSRSRGRSRGRGRGVFRGHPSSFATEYTLPAEPSSAINLNHQEGNTKQAVESESHGLARGRRPGRSRGSKVSQMPASAVQSLTSNQYSSHPGDSSNPRRESRSFTAINTISSLPQVSTLPCKLNTSIAGFHQPGAPICIEPPSLTIAAAAGGPASFQTMHHQPISVIGQITQVLPRELPREEISVSSVEQQMTSAQKEKKKHNAELLSNHATTCSSNSGKSPVKNSKEASGSNDMSQTNKNSTDQYSSVPKRFSVSGSHPVNPACQGASYGVGQSESGTRGVPSADRSNGDPKERPRKKQKVAPNSGLKLNTSVKFAGRRIRHEWIVQSNTGLRKWYEGTVLKILTGDDGGLKSRYLIKYDEELEACEIDHLVEDYLEGSVIIL